MTIGLISDTHNFLDPKIEVLLKGVDHILHAGDVGLPWVLLQLEQIAPVTAVLGNTDAGIQLRETEVRELDDHTFLVHHSVNPNDQPASLKNRILQSKADFVIFGHTHKLTDQKVQGVRFINPGYAGKPKFAQPRSVAVLHTSPGTMELEVLPL